MSSRRPRVRLAALAGPAKLSEMVRKLVRWLPALALLGSVSCAFLLDFDELKGEPGDAGSDTSSGGVAGGGGSGGAVGGSAGVAGSGGSAGDAGPCGKSCDDGDPCTTDVCLTPEGGTPTCGHVGKLYDDGQLDLPAEEYLGGLSAVGGSDRFYVSKYFGTKLGDAGTWQFDSSVFAVPVDGSLQKTAEYPLGPSFGGGPRGPVSLVHDGSDLIGFLAVQVSGFEWRVKQLAFPADLGAAPTAADVCSGACYDLTIDGTLRPEGFLGPSGEPGAMWIGPNGIWIGNASTKPTQKTITASKVTGLAPVISESAIGAFWRDDTTLNVTITGTSETSMTPASCDTTKGFFGGLVAAGRGRLWTGAFTTNIVAAGPSTEFNSFLITGNQVQELSSCKSNPESLIQGVNLPGMTAFKRPASSPDERVHFAVAGINAAESSLALTASYVELQPGKAELAGIAKFEMTGSPSTKLPSSKGVDQPVVAHAGDKLLVAWRDSGAAGGFQATLRLRRFKLCQ